VSRGVRTIIRATTPISTRDYLPNNRQETGRSLASRNEVGEGDKGHSEDRLVEEHDEIERVDESWIDGDRIAQRI
jgi:hypothetical protein